MEFLATLPPVQSKNLYPCLASITIAPPGSTSDRSRRLSTGSAEGSAVADDGDDNLIKRVISGGRRKSSFGTTANGAGATAQGGGEGGGAANRRMSIAPSAMGHGGVTMGSNATGPEGVQQGTWFWRVQAGVFDNNLVLLPISSPANPLLTAPPAPLSSAMPAHHTSNKSGSGSGSGHQHQGGEGIVDKVKDLFRRGSSTSSGKADAAHVDTDGNDRIIDQTPGGEQLPSASANSVGANNLNANAETGWPGVVDGEKLQAVVVPLNQLDKSKVKVSGGKRGEASWVTVPITSHFAHMIQGHADGATAPKSGVIRLEFDKDWIGSKGEAELLHHHITQALSNRSPQPPQVQLGQNHHALQQSVHGQGSASGRHTAGNQVIDDHDQGHTLSQALGYTPDESVASSRKVAG